MLNFASQAARDCRLVAEDLRAGEMFDDATTIDRLGDMIARAEHFALPENGCLFDDELRALTGLALRLPFQTMKERMDARRPRRLERMRRDSIRQPTGDANRPGAERPAVLI